MENRKKEKTIVLVGALLVTLISVAFKGDWHTVGIYAGCGISQRLAYPLFHAGVFHALLNGWCMVALVFIYDITMARLALAYVVAVTVPIDTLHQLIPSLAQPTVGLSAMVYFLFGTISFEVRRRLYYQSWMLVYLSLGFLFPNTSAWLHLYCYALGILFALLNKPIPICDKK